MKKLKELKIKEIENILSGRKPKVLGSYAYFSVLVPLVEKDGEIHILYEVRSSNLKKQPGEICFPGGHMEEGETPKECAVRETAEELCIRHKDINVIAKLDHMPTYSNFTMYSYLGVIDYDIIANTIVNEAEVKEIFLVPIKFLLDTEPFIYEFDVIPKVGDDFPYEMINSDNGYNWRKGKSIVPIYRYNDYVIWGLTGRITYNLMNILKNKV